MLSFPALCCMYATEATMRELKEAWEACAVVVKKKMRGVHFAAGKGRGPRQPGPALLVPAGRQVHSPWHLKRGA